MAYPTANPSVPLPRPAAPTKPVAGYGSRPTTPGWTVAPNYRALLGGDLALQGTLQGISAQGAQGQLGYTAARNQALVGYGGVPGNVSGVDATTRGLASQATQSGLSTLAQLQHDYGQAQSHTVGNLQARGLLHSGAYLQHSRENLRGLTLGQANAATSLQDKLAGLSQSHLDAQQSLAKEGYTATSDALNRIIGQINTGLIAPRRTAAAPVRLRNAGQVARNTL